MCTITATELKRNFGKYALLAQKEEIVVTSFGKFIFKMVPASCEKIKVAESLIGILPKDASIGVDPNERG